MPKELLSWLEHDCRGMWHGPQCPQCPPGYCCHLLAGPNPAPVLSLATVPRPGDPTVTPLSCAPLPGTQGSVAPCMALGWTPHGAPQASLLRGQGSRAPKLLTVSVRDMAGCNPVLTCSLGCRFLPHRHSPGTQTPPCPAYPPPLPYNMHRHTTCPLQASPLHMGLASPDLCWWTQGQDRALGRQQGVRAAALLWLVSPGRFQLCFSPGLPSGRGSLHRDSHLPAPVLSPGSCRAAEIRRVLSSS